jgi:hypothetical protein
MWTVDTHSGDVSSQRLLPGALSGIGGISCLTSKICFVNGAIQAPAYADRLYTTLNGGSSWSIDSLPVDLDGSSSISCAATERCIAIAEFSGASTHIALRG